MLAPSRLSKPLLAVLLAVATSPISLAADVLPDPLLEYRTGQQVHGLYEIREAARAFVSSESKRTKKRWQVGGPDIRIQVPECAVPLRMRWSNDGPIRIVVVECRRTIDGAYKERWAVDVPVVPVDKQQ